MFKDKEKRDKQRRVRRTPSFEEKLQAKAFQWLEEAAADDPILRDAVIAKFTGVDPARVDRQITFKQEIESVLIKESIKKIKDDEKLREVLVRAEIFKIMEMEDPELKPKSPKPHPLDEMINNMKKYKELKALVVPKKSIWEDLLEEALKFVAILIQNGQHFQAPETLVYMFTTRFQLPPIFTLVFFAIISII